MRKISSGNDPSTERRGFRTKSRGNTALGTPVVTSLGLFHQQPIARSNSERETLSPAPAHAGGGGGGLIGVCDEHDNKLLERHTSAAKDGVIDMLTAKASKLGVSLERAMMAKKDAEDRVSKIEGLLDEETTKRKDVEHRLQRQQTNIEVVAREKESLHCETQCLRGNLADIEQRSKDWVQEETERRRAAEQSLAREHSLAKEYLKGVYREQDAPEIGKGPGAVAEVLVRESCVLREALRKRDVDLDEHARRLEGAVEDLKAEQDRRQVMQSQLALTKERLEAAKSKARQVSNHLGVEAGDNQTLRERMRVMGEESELRIKQLQDWKEKAQRRKKGDTRDMMAGSKAKEDRIKKLETTLKQERERLERDLHSARSDYEEAAKESHRKNARLQRRCLELEYLLSEKSKKSHQIGVVGVGGTGGSNPSSAASSSGLWNASQSGALRANSGAPSRRETGAGVSSTSSGDPASDVAAEGLISVASMLPWRGGSNHTAIKASFHSGIDVGRQATGTGTATDAAARLNRNPERPSADLLPDPLRNNESAPAWMRADLAVDRVQVDHP